MLQTIILAAGKGTRMKSDLAKVAHKLNDKPMVHYVLDTAKNVNSDHIYLIIGHQADYLKEITADYNVIYTEQKEQLGTGHAIMMVEPELKTTEGTTLILCGDVPLLTTDTLAKLLEFHNEAKASATILTIELLEPKHYGRIIRNEDFSVDKIVEYRDATEEERAVNEINSGIYAFKTADLFAAITELKNDSDQNEYYLTDIIEILKGKGKKVSALITDNELEVHGINDQNDLKRAEDELIKAAAHAG
jgi:UDP-N-acetylglucosamine pyrophosphorylase